MKAMKTGNEDFVFGGLLFIISVIVFLVLKIAGVISSYWWIVVLLIIAVIVFFLLHLLAYTVFRAAFRGTTEAEMIKYIKSFLGIDFQGAYTVIKFEQRMVDCQKCLSLKLTDESFQEITAFLEKLDTEITYNEDKAVADKDGWLKVNKNIIRKIHNENDESSLIIYSEELTIDSENKILTFRANGY